MLLDQGVEGALLAVVSVLDVRDIEGDRPLAFGDIHHAVCRNEEELGLGIDEFLDEPRAGHPVHFHPFTRDPFHTASSSLVPWKSLGASGRLRNYGLAWYTQTSG